MEVYRNLEQIKNAPASAVALGMFDGVHRGHRRVIEAAVSYEGLSAAVLTFTTNHQRPSKKMHQRDILTIDGRISMLEKLPVDRVYLPDFDSFKSMTPDQFITEILHKTLNAKAVCCGEDFRFGRNASGNVNYLKRFCDQLGIQVTVVPPLLDHRAPISSTRIRQALQDGDIPTANRLLGYSYFIEGEVIYGRQLGRQINCPTINQALDSKICIPKYGVYVSTTRVDGVDYPSITNIGVKPTIEGDRMPLAETHVIGINQMLYGRVLRVTLYQFIRSEERFDSIEELSHSIHRDIHTAKLYFSNPDVRKNFEKSEK
ncbi:MAG: bifunctional riboflavin kinase/FAD synthetase [Massiliimalia sp.]